MSVNDAGENFFTLLVRATPLQLMLVTLVAAAGFTADGFMAGWRAGIIPRLA